MRYLLAVTLFALLLLASATTLKLGEAAAGRAVPLTGTWQAEFTLDSIRPPTWEPRSRSVARRTTGEVRLTPGLPAWLANRQPFWRTGFSGSHSVDFAPLCGFNGSRAPEAIGIRFASDSVHLHLSGYCCHTGGVWLKGRIIDHTIAGDWVTDSDGWGAWGKAVLRRR